MTKMKAGTDVVYGSESCREVKQMLRANSTLKHKVSRFFGGKKTGGSYTYVATTSSTTPLLGHIRPSNLCRWIIPTSSSHKTGPDGLLGSAPGPDGLLGSAPGPEGFLGSAPGPEGLLGSAPGPGWLAFSPVPVCRRRRQLCE